MTKEVVKEVKIKVLCDDLAPPRGIALAQHGVSYYINLKYEGYERNILFDTCSSYDVIKYNASLMNVDLKKIDAIVISHGHYDHGGGLKGVLEQVNAPVFAHPEIFRENFRLPYRYIGLPREHIAELKAKSNFVLTRDAIEIFPGVWTSGEVPRLNKYEIVEDVFTIKEGKVVKDQMIDDTSLFIDIGQSLLVVSGCSHAGIVNIKNHAERMLSKKVSHIIGGLHLLDAGEERVEFTISNLEGIELFLGHCTGERVVNRFIDKYGDKARRIYSSFEFSIKEGKTILKQ